MKIAKFEFSPGARFQKGAQSDDKAAQRVGEHIEMLRKQHKGELTPEDILADAEHGNSPLHDYFEWSDTEAAKQYRLQQARGLIRSVVAVYVQPDKPAVRTRAYVHINEPSAPHYRETSHAMSISKTRDLVLKRAWDELQQWRARYRDLEEFASLIRVIDALAIEMQEEQKETA